MHVSIETFGRRKKYIQKKDSLSINIDFGRLAI